VRPWYVNNSNNRSNANNRNNFNNNGSFLRIVQAHAKITFIIMQLYRDLWSELCSYENLELAYKKARKHKTTKDYVIEFEKNLTDNLLLLRSELLLHCYKPKPLVNFIIRDPKTRKISKSDFRDRVIHHAVCNIIEPIFDKCFIYYSYANRLGKGSLKAIERFDCFKRKVSRNNTRKCFVLKADIRKYFDNIDHSILIKIIKKGLEDKKIIWLITRILANSCHNDKRAKGMPLGNLTSQFFANVYLNELDQFVKHKLKAKHYIRYVDDFVILHHDKKLLECYQSEINKFLKYKLRLELHPDKSRIVLLKQGIGFLGFRIFYYHRLLKKKNIRRFRSNLALLCLNYDLKLADYDKIYDFLEGWLAYSRYANAYNLKTNILKQIETKFSGEISTKEINRLTRSS